jgi:hypothetical protein
MNLLIKTLASAKARNFTSRDPLQEQRAILRYLLSKGTHTHFGKDHAFNEFASLPFEKAYAEYQKKVPIRTYHEFWDNYFRKYFCIKGGEKSFNLENVTWPGKIPLFCETSGTTAPTKYIPFSKEMFAANKKAAIDLTSCYLAKNGSADCLPASSSTWQATRNSQIWEWCTCEHERYNITSAPFTSNHCASG